MNDFEARIMQLKRMHEYIIGLNNADAYYEWTMNGIPDCPREEEFEFFAEDEERYMGVWKLFMCIMGTYPNEN